MMSSSIRQPALILTRSVSQLWSHQQPSLSNVTFNNARSLTTAATDKNAILSQLMQTKDSFQVFELGQRLMSQHKSSLNVNDYSQLLQLYKQFNHEAEARQVTQHINALAYQSVLDLCQQKKYVEAFEQAKSLGVTTTSWIHLTETTNNPSTHKYTINQHFNFATLIDIAEKCGEKKISEELWIEGVEAHEFVPKIQRRVPRHLGVYDLLTFPPVVTVSAVRHYLLQYRRQYQQSGKWYSGSMSMIIGKGYRARYPYDNPQAAITRESLKRMLKEEFDLDCDYAVNNNGILVIRRSVLQPWIVNRVLPAKPAISPPVLYVAKLTIQQAEDIVHQHIATIVRNFMNGVEPKHGIHISTGGADATAAIPFMPEVRIRLIHILLNQYDMPIRLNPNNETMIEMNRSLLMQWLRKNQHEQHRASWDTQFAQNLKQQSEARLAKQFTAHELLSQVQKHVKGQHVDF